MRIILMFVLILLVVAVHGQDNLLAVNGTKLFVSIVGKGEPLVVLHGGPGLNHSYFKPHLQPLEQSFKVIYYDQRASGRSAVPSPDSISFRFLVEDLEALRQKLKIDKLNILAHSWGVVLAVNYALTYPKNINKMIFSNPAMLSREFDQEAAQIAKQRTTKEDSVTRAKLISSGPMDVKKFEDFFLLSFKNSAYDVNNLKNLTLNLQPEFAHASKALFTGLMKDPAQTKNFYSELNALTFPILVIHGQADALPPASLQKLRDSLPDVQYEVLLKSGHFPFIEETEKFNQIVTEFLRAKKNKRKR